MSINIRKMRYLPIVAALALAGCGGDDGGAGSASALSSAGAPHSGSSPTVTAPPSASNVDKSVSPVELPDTVVPVNYRLWFRPNDALNAFDGRADVGAVPRPGAATFDPAAKAYTVTGGGENMWAAADAFHFAWTKVTGDVSLTADVAFAGVLSASETHSRPSPARSGPSCPGRRLRAPVPAWRPPCAAGRTCATR